MCPLNFLRTQEIQRELCNEFPDGQLVLLTLLMPGQQATVLQLPAEPQKAQPEPAANRAVERDLADALG